MLTQLPKIYENVHQFAGLSARKKMAVSHRETRTICRPIGPNLCRNQFGARSPINGQEWQSFFSIPVANVEESPKSRQNTDKSSKNPLESGR